MIFFKEWELLAKCLFISVETQTDLTVVVHKRKRRTGDKILTSQI